MVPIFLPTNVDLQPLLHYSQLLHTSSTVRFQKNHMPKKFGLSLALVPYLPYLRTFHTNSHVALFQACIYPHSRRG